MKVEFSNHIKSKKPLIMKFVEELSKDFKYVSVLATDVIGKTFSVDFNSTSVGDSMLYERGYVTRIFNGINYSEYSFNDFSEENYDLVIKEAKDLVNKDFNLLKESNVPVMEFPLIEEEKIAKSLLGEVDNLPQDVPVQQKVDKLVGLVDKSKKHCKLLVNARFSYEEAKIAKGFYSINKQLEQTYLFTIGGMLAVAQKDGVMKYEHESFSDIGGFEIMDKVEASFRDVIDGVVELLDSEPVTPGEYDVICNPTVTGLIAHEAFGHGVEMDMFVKNRAKGAEYLGKYVASKKTEMRDGAASAVDVASYLFDDEGTMGTDTVIIDKGILITGISDLLSAMALKTTPTGNGRRESFERKAYARMTNTFFAQGEDDLEDMIASIEYGYLLENYNSGMEDPKNWGIQCMVTKGREIKNGKLTGKIVSPVMLTGYVPDILSSISMVSNTEVDLKGGGYCGKGYKEWVKTSIGGTYLKAKARLG